LLNTCYRKLTYTPNKYKASQSEQYLSLKRTKEIERDEPSEMPEWLLANGTTRFVGEPVAAVVATDRYTAEDIVDLVIVEYEPREAVVDAMDAREDSGIQLNQ
jgi:CO/xanthine dehydrogenase Mo-binding subunit